MKKDSGRTALPSRATYDVLEEMARLKIQEFIQEVFNEELCQQMWLYRRSWNLQSTP